MSFPFALSRDDRSAAFFDALADGRLLLRRDPASGTLHGPAASDPAFTWAEADGEGTVASWAVVHARDADPVLVGIVELDEGPWLRTQLVGVDADDVRAGLRVRVTPVVPGAGSEPIPAFTPV
ncbi:hypothetical protein Acsp06_44940 [Actinomycetospora sp. NBRC 106375]|uniref:Zn-ribbon domain-containing OB-fold protein n=1 Tax=Actinomycetospora sp. NBRC 106375 TaxID=3032207 RepID=UPI0024A33770|nr:OB-fold domain-containing protein [Actinomycetospora sp. NBRC 106375]GLZ48309.1 hypothetical protein Acsp06_44940 [Actinomycetospora sp. NBRC 106375]